MPDTQSQPSVPGTTTRERSARPSPAALVVAVLFVAMIGLSIWYLTRHEPLVLQGEVQSREFDLAARVDGRISQIVVTRAQDVKQGAALIRIDNPELKAKIKQSARRTGRRRGGAGARRPDEAGPRNRRQDLHAAPQRTRGRPRPPTLAPQMTTGGPKAARRIRYGWKWRAAALL